MQHAEDVKGPRSRLRSSRQSACQALAHLGRWHHFAREEVLSESIDCAPRRISKPPADFSLGVVSGFRRGFRSREVGGCLPSRCIASSRHVVTSNLGPGVGSSMPPSFRVVACALSSSLPRPSPAASLVRAPLELLTRDRAREGDVA